MRIRVLQWNIGGGKIRGEHDRLYMNDGRAYIARLMKSLHLDVVTLQETHTNPIHQEIEDIVQMSGLPFYVNDVYGASHVEPGQYLGLAIASRFPLIQHRFEEFIDQGYQFRLPTGEVKPSDPKGIQTACLDLPNHQQLVVQNLHLIPFAKLGLHPLGKETATYRHDLVSHLIKKQKPYLLQGDFNFHQPGLRPLLEDFFDEETQEILLSEPTTPKGRTYDHVVYRGMEVYFFQVLSYVLTDHFPLLTEFDLS